MTSLLMHLLKLVLIENKYISAVVDHNNLVFLKILFLCYNNALY